MRFKYYDDDGNEVNPHEAIATDGALRSGIKSVRVPMMMMDGKTPKSKQSPTFRTVDEAYSYYYALGVSDARKTVQHDPMGREQSSYETEEEERQRRKRKRGGTGDAALGFTDSRGINFPPDPRMIA